MSKLEAALDAARRGFRVFPLIPNEKKPQIENWQNLATTNEESIRKCWTEDPDRNIGIVTQRHVVIDIDPRNGGDLSFQELVLTEEFPKTLRTRTAGGGDHIIYALPDHVFVRCSKSKIGKGIDIKSYGGLIVAPGSTVDGKAYTWGNDRAPALAPQWLLDRCRAPVERTAAAGKRLVEEDATAIDMALQWLSKSAPEAVLGELNDTAYKVACKLFDFGVAVETATELMREWGDACCSPRLEDNTIADVLDHAAKYRNRAIGVDHPSMSFDAVDIDEDKKPATNSQALLPANDFIFLEGDIAADKALTNGSRPLIKGLYDQNSLIVMVGAPGGGKSFGAMDQARSIIKGALFAGRMKATKGAVVYVAAEGGEGVFRRLAAMRLHYKDDLKGLYVLPRGVDLLHTPADAERIIAEIRRIEAKDDVKVRLVIVDTVARALAGGDENSSQDMGAFIKNLDRIRLGAGCAAMGIHHTGKDANRGARGHSSLLGAVDTEILVANGQMTVTKQRDMDKAVTIYFKLNPIRVGIDSEGEEVTSCYFAPCDKGEDHAIPLTALQKEILELIMDDYPELPFTIKQLADCVTRSGSNTSSNRSALRKHLKALSDHGRVTQDSRNDELWQYVSKAA